MKKFETIKNFLLDAKAISPAIATLILIVIAAVAAAGIGILVQSAQHNTESQVGHQDLSVSGTINVKGSTTILPISIDEAKAFMKLDPAAVINVAGGGSGTGRALVFNKQVDIGASSDQWGNAGTDPTSGLWYDSRANAVLQAAGKDAFINELKIGTSMVVVAGNVGAKQIHVSNTTATGIANNIFNIKYSDLQAAYIPVAKGGTGGELKNAGASLTPAVYVVHRSDAGGTQEVFSAWLMAGDKNNISATSTDIGVGKQGNEGVRDYISSTPNTIGFVDVAFSDNYAANITSQTVMPQGKKEVVAAYMDNSVKSVAALKTTRGLSVSGDLGTYNSASIYTTSVDDVTKQYGLARDLYYYSQPGAPTGVVKAFEDFVMSNDGQTILNNDGFFSPT